MWISESNVGGGNAANLRKQNITLQEQNNALKLKNDILMDMVCEIILNFFVSLTNYFSKIMYILSSINNKN